MPFLRVVNNILAPRWMAVSVQPPERSHRVLQTPYSMGSPSKSMETALSLH